jgi:deoxyribodipyrimidine photo-lyase
MPIPSLRLRQLNDRPIRDRGQYVLYWMTAHRRAHWNFSLEHAAEMAADLKKPLVVFEALRIGYRWASDRLHRFVVQGMAENARRFADRPVLYYPYVEPEQRAAEGLLEALAAEACAVVTDDFPCFFIPAMLRLAARRLDVRLDAVDSNGILPMRSTNQVFTVAHSFRRWLQKNLRPHLNEFPAADPLARRRLPALETLPAKIMKRWPRADVEALSQNPDLLAKFAIDHTVAPADVAGGSRAAEKTLTAFFKHKLDRYATERNDPDADASSGLSPYLHFGHISAHDIFHQATKREGWTIEQLAEKPTGTARDWWNASEPLEAFLDELITWREIGYNRCAHDPHYDRYETLPDWAKKTLAKHARDPRPQLYSLEELEAAETYDEIWNAAQRQLVRTGRIHNYLRMLWGKKILEWSPTPQEALAAMIELNNKYALDGRNPNSYSGIFWVLGRYDRAWGPERRIFGTVRYMSSDSTAKKIKLKQYLKTYGG